jgi:conjugal transfer pilus assembly protein TraW
MKILFSILFAHDLGCFGETFSIQEQNMIEVIQKKLKKTSLEKHQKIIQERIKKSIERPKYNKEIVTTKIKRTFIFEPSVVVSKDLKDHSGKVFIARGTKINPLHIRSLTKPLLFINGDEEDQREWAQNKLKKNRLAKIILIKGEPLKLMKKWRKAIYFDQQGLLVKKLGIRHVPAFVTQKDDVLEIQEVKPDED